MFVVKARVYIDINSEYVAYHILESSNFVLLYTIYDNKNYFRYASLIQTIKYIRFNV